MRRVVVFLCLLLPFCASAQWVDVSALVGAAPYKISAGIKNGVSGCANASVSLVKLKIIDAGIQFSGMNTITLCSAYSIGVFFDYVITADKNIILLGIHGNQIYYGDIPKGGNYFNSGIADTAAIRLNNTVAYGLRLGYKRELREHLFGYALISPTYSISPINLGNSNVLNCALFSIPIMVGVSLRF